MITSKCTSKTSKLLAITINLLAKLTRKNPRVQRGGGHGGLGLQGMTTVLLVGTVWDSVLGLGGDMTPDETIHETHETHETIRETKETERKYNGYPFTTFTDSFRLSWDEYYRVLVS